MSAVSADPISADKHAVSSRNCGYFLISPRYTFKVFRVTFWLFTLTNYPSRPRLSQTLIDHDAKRHDRSVTGNQYDSPRRTQRTRRRRGEGRGIWESRGIRGCESTAPPPDEGYHRGTEAQSRKGFARNARFFFSLCLCVSVVKYRRPRHLLIPLLLYSAHPPRPPRPQR